MEQVPCPSKNCNMHFPKFESYYTNRQLIYFRIHLEYHDELQNQNLKCGPESYPCLKCPDYFDTYNELYDHVDEHHPRFTYNCPVPNCTYSCTKYNNRQVHYRNIHRNTLHGRLGFTCDVSY